MNISRLTPQVRTRFLFENHSAVLYGSSYFLPNLRACDLSYFVPANVALLVSRFESNEEVEYLNSPLQSGVSTGPSFLLFYGASTRCFKTVANISYLLPNCSNNLTTSMWVWCIGSACSLFWWMPVCAMSWCLHCNHAPVCKYFCFSASAILIKKYVCSQKSMYASSHWICYPCVRLYLNALFPTNILRCITVYVHSFSVIVWHQNAWCSVFHSSYSTWYIHYIEVYLYCS